MSKVTRKNEYDKLLAEAVLRRLGPISRVGIYEKTGLSRTTISLVTRELLKEGRLIVSGKSNHPLGRKQVLLELNKDFGSHAVVSKTRNSCVSSSTKSLAGRFAMPEDVSAAFALLAGKEAGMINCHTLAVDGCWTAW